MSFASSARCISRVSTTLSPPRHFRCAYHSSHPAKSSAPVGSSGRVFSESVYQVPRSSKTQVNSNWRTLEDQPLTNRSINDLLANAIPSIRHPNFLSKEECERLVKIVTAHQIVSLLRLLDDAANKLTQLRRAVITRKSSFPQSVL
jgi:hypothetical protein